jgi:hypothetical protein
MKAHGAMVGALVGAALLASSGSAKAGFIDDNATFSLAISVLRAAIGEHPRVLNIEADGNGIEIQMQDPHNRSHIDRWRYGIVNYLGMIPLRRLTGPEPVDPTLINPDIEANLFDLDSIDFSAAPKLIEAGIARARLQDAARVTHMEIQRQTFILPEPSSGDVRWTLHIDSGRERANIIANARGVIVGADLSGTQRAKMLNILQEPELAADAATAFRTAIGPQPVLTKVGIEGKTISFGTNMRDQSLAKLGSGLPATAAFTWDLDGLQQRLGTIDVSAQMGMPAPTSFSVNDVDWTIIGKLEQDALAKAAIPQSSVKHIGLGTATDQPGQPTLTWTVEIEEPSGEVTTVVADKSGAIERVDLPESRRPRIDWLDPKALAGAIARVGAIFGQNAKIASIVADDRRGRITIDDPAHGGQAATFDFTGDGVSRAGISFALDSMGPRFTVTDLATLNEQKLLALQADAFKRLSGARKAYLESVTIGAHPFVRQAGAHAIEVRLRDIAEDSAKAEYAWIVYDFSGRVLDFVTF